MTFEFVTSFANQILSDAIMVVKFSVDDGVNGIFRVMDGLAAVRTKILDSKATVTKC